MSPSVATLVFSVGIAGLFFLNRDREVYTSKALWLPVVWVSIGCSRNISEWLQIGTPEGSQGDRYLEGSPLDRDILGALLVLGLIVLFTRRHQVMALLRSNFPIVLYFIYCGFSILWSDYSFVAFKRWNRALGDVVMVLIVLTEQDSLSAIKRLLARVGFLLLPLSVLLIRYYPELGRSYGSSDGSIFWTGVAEGKNTLGILCLVFGLASLWRVLEAYLDREDPRRRRLLIAHGVMSLVAIWLLWEANSMTSMACLVLATGLMVAATTRRFGANPRTMYLLLGVVVATSAFVLFSGLSGGVLKTIGRNPTLTGRTEVWGTILQHTVDPIFGAGYESFWLGDRLASIHEIVADTINQCHNGYLEIYVNLGWVGVMILFAILIQGCRRVVWRVQRDETVGKLMLSYFAVAVIFNFTEAGFKMMSPVWFVFLLSVMAAPVIVGWADTEVAIETLSEDDDSLVDDSVYVHDVHASSDMNPVRSFE